ncbi:sulfotransferase ssu-1-like [Uloborus diversus]|uniref:sulfotransferase ssu-1-like n=1 Tax=Uloborus diversus TaxID=327109 RepID=UPI00240A8627|nr:sulfotransferase ssu-1-like [Uloborus diversus]
MNLDNIYSVEVEGIRIPAFFSKECFSSALRFEPKPGDIIIATYPKCGTTWMQNLVLNILRKAKPLDHPRDFFLASPFLDQLGGEDSEKMMIRPGTYKTHLPFHKVPWLEEAKYIYVARNPKDCCVSFYYHMRDIPGYQFSDNTFNDFLNLFLRGQLEFNDYFGHLLSWYNNRNKSNVFFTTYEHMQKDLRTVAVDVATFLGGDYANFLSENPEDFADILHRCSFEEMKKFIDEGLSFLYNIPENLLDELNVPKGRKHIIRYNASLPKRKTVKLNFIRAGKIQNSNRIRMDEPFTSMEDVT